MSAPIVYRSTDTGAPVLSGTAGALLTVLDAILVNGYGSQPAAGWTKGGLANASNRGAYQQGSGSLLFLSVDDNAPSSARDARVRGFETLSAVTPTGTGQCPNGSTPVDYDGNAQPAFKNMRKSTTADATARAWICIADSATFHFFVLTGDLGGNYFGTSVGDIVSFVPNDLWKFGLVGRNTEIAGLESVVRQGYETSNHIDYRHAGDVNVAGTGASAGGHHIIRSWTAAGPSRPLCRLGIGSLQMREPFTGIGGLNPPDSKIYLNRFLLVEQSLTAGIRGYVRGVYQMLNGGAGIIDGDTFSGAGDFAGRTFLVLNQMFGGAVLALETTPWDV